MVANGNRLAGKIALVTGAASGIGLAVTQTFLSEGAKVFGVDFSESNIETASSLLSSQSFDPSTYRFHYADAADESAVIAFVEKCTQELGGLDVAVLNAGIGKITPISKLTLEEYDQHMRVNARGRNVSRSQICCHKDAESGKWRQYHHNSKPCQRSSISRVVCLQHVEICCPRLSRDCGPGIRKRPNQSECSLSWFRGHTSNSCLG
ncbi:hypothetical protein CLAIMM_09115 isoform 2 [Cladophialophora immunda]|nr:hypothetical protein CLAIMM_09115 isoform 1 [Cladophialophora immunda]OQV04198.1 hypothetical protein CLAIMM_09115 isoform 2 [Cladophialophora immunda]